MEVTFKKIITKLINDPIYSLNVLVALVRGTCYSLYYRLFTKKIRIKLPFKAFARVKIIGPGSVLIDKNCAAGLSVFKGLTIVTLSDEAVVRIGQNCNLEGLTIRCRNRVEFGERIITAVSLVQDFLFLNANDTNNAPIVVGNNVWLSNDAMILSGSQIGDDCVLGAKALCKGINIGTYSIANGNPVKRGLPIENLLKLKGVM